MSDNPIREALELLRRDGWCKKDRLNEHGEMCGVGAVAAVLSGDAHVAVIKYGHEWCSPHNSPPVQVMAEVARDQYPDRRVGLFFEFNDHPDTTFADVEAVMEKAALRLDERVSA